MQKVSQSSKQDRFKRPTKFFDHSLDSHDELERMSCHLHKKRIQSLRQRLGAVTVELAFTIGLAFLFFFVGLEFSRVSMIQHSIENAAYEGARVGAVPGGTSTEVTQEVQRILRIVGVRNSEIQVNPSQIQLDTPDIVVSVRVPLDGNLFLPPLFFRDRVLERSFRMQRETSISRL